MSTSRSHPPSPISPARFNLLKTQAINGDPNATSTLHLVFSYNNFLGLDDVLPVIYAHLSPRHLAQVKDTDGVVAMNARYALKMLAHGLDKSQQQQQPFPPNGLEALCPPLSSWITHFISSAHILDSPLLLREIGHIIPSLLRHTPLLHALRKEGRLLPLTMDTFLQLPPSSPARPDFQTAVLTALIAEAKLVPGHPDLEHSMRLLLASPARLPDVALALIRSLAFDTGEGKEKMMSLSSLRLSLSTIFYARSCIPSLRRALAVHGVLDVLCLAARRASKGLYHCEVKGMVGSCMCLLIQELSVFTRMAPRFVVRALSEGHLLDTLLRVERVVGGDLECFEDQEDRGHLSAMIGGCFGYVQAFLVYRSVGRVCRRTMRLRYDRDEYGCGVVGGEVGRRYERLKEAVEIRTREGEVYERVEGRCVCVNPDCPSTEAAAKPRRCSGCLFAIYCSRPCQKTHWANGHRTQCQVLDRARSSPSHSLHLPPSPLDMDMIYAMVQDDLREHASLIERKLSSSGKSSTPRPGPLIIELDYSDGSRPRISVRPLDAFRRAVEESSVIEYTDEMWDHLLDRLGDRGGGGKYIAIMISGMWLVDLTTEERIQRRVYPVDVLPVVG